MTDDYDSWRRRLPPHNERLPVNPSFPEPGLWRMRHAGEWVPVQIWHDVDRHSGEISFYALRAGAPVAWASVWPVCAPHPISRATYTKFQETGKWPDEIEIPKPPLPNHEQDPAERLASAILALESTAITWYESIGSRIESQEQSDKAANFAEEFRKLEVEVEKVWKDERKPVDLALKQLEATWRPVQTRAHEASVLIKQKWVREYLVGEEIKLDLSGAKQRHKRAAKPKAGLGARSVATRRIPMAEIIDIRTFLHWHLGLPKLDPRLERIAQSIANKAVTACPWKPIPGVRQTEKIIVA